MSDVQVNESEIFELDPTEIGINSELPRQRKDLGEIAKMAESIRLYGQMQPIVINRNKELIAGGRRLAACLLGGFKARVCYKDTIDPLLMREMELEENVQRKALTPAEECLAIDDLVKLKQAKYGKPVQGRQGGFTLDDAAELIGKTKGNVIEAIQLADAIRNFPELRKADSKSEIKKAVKGLERVQQNIIALASYESTIKMQDEFILVNQDAEHYLKGLGDKTVDLFFTDPPYGIDIHDISMTTGGKTGGEHTTTGIKYDDSEDSAKKLLTIIARESARVTKDTGHAYIFCAPSHFTWLSAAMSQAGWIVYPRPIVWIKRSTGQNNQPSYWPSAAYEFILFARKTDSRIIVEGKPDWIQCDIVGSADRVHQAEKPVELCKELISRVTLPNYIMLDPCMGSGALIEAGYRMKLKSLGCELSVESYAAALSRMTKLKEGK